MSAQLTNEQLAHQLAAILAGPAGDRMTPVEAEYLRMAEAALRAQGEWIPVTEREPDIALGDDLHCFVLLKLKKNGRLICTDAYWANKPVDPKWEDGEEEAPDWALSSDYDRYIPMVGWCEKGCHPDYSDYYQPFEDTYREIIAWMPVTYPDTPHPQGEEHGG